MQLLTNNIMIRNSGAVDPWINLDGRLNAPAGTPQFPNLLSTYHDTGVPDARYRWPSTLSAIGGNITQPPWMVAGVDYHVGIDRKLYPTDANLKDPATITDPGVNLDTVQHLVEITGANVTLDGYDYSLSGGWQVIPENANIVLSNSKWVIGTNNNSCIWAHGGTGVINLTVINCELNGSFNANDQTGTLLRTDGPQLTVRYCYLQNSPGDHINFTFGDFVDIRFSLFKDNGTINAHPDWLSFGGNNATPYGPCTVNFNTWWQSPSVQNGTQGVGIAGDAGSSLRGASEVAYNTMLNLGGNNTNTSGYNVSCDCTQFVGGAGCKVHDNFCDPTWVGAGGAQNFAAWLFLSIAGSSTALRVFRQTNMLNGQVDVAPQFAGTGP